MAEHGEMRVAGDERPLDLAATFTQLVEMYRAARTMPERAKLLLPGWITDEQWEQARPEVERIAASYGLALPIEVEFMR